MMFKYNGGFSGNLILLVLILSVLGVAISMYTGFLAEQQHTEQPFKTKALLVYPEPRIVGDFSYYDQHGGNFSINELQGHWSLVFLGFTHCPDICPNTLAVLASASEQLRAELPESMQAKVVFVSVDSERDHPAQLKQYIEHFDPGFYAVSGEEAQLMAFSYQLGAAYRVEPHEAGETAYGVDHSASIFLLNPDARLYGHFQTPHEAGLIATELKQLILAGTGKDDRID